MSRVTAMSDKSPDYQSISVLIQPSREGDSDAQANLLAHLQDYVRLMAEQNLEPSLRQKAGYSDIAQEAMTRVIENFDQFNGDTGAEFRGWLKAIVINEINRLRRTYRTAKRDIGREREMESDRPSIGRFIPSDANPTPSSDAIAREQVAKFDEILSELSEDYAMVIRLRGIEKLSFKEVAQRMQKSHDSVTKLWYRAILKLEEKLQEHQIDF